MHRLLLLLVMVARFATPAFAQTPPSVAFAWRVADAAHGTGVVTWSGGPLVKCRSTQCAAISGEASGTLEVPGPAPVDYFWRPIPGDRYCVGGVCDTVPEVVRVYERYLPIVWR